MSFLNTNDSDYMKPAIWTPGHSLKQQCRYNILDNNVRIKHVVWHNPAITGHTRWRYKNPGKSERQPSNKVCYNKLSCSVKNLLHISGRWRMDNQY